VHSSVQLSSGEQGLRTLCGFETGIVGGWHVGRVPGGTDGFGWIQVVTE